MTVCDWLRVATVSEVIKMICMSSRSWNNLRLKCVLVHRSEESKLQVSWNMRAKKQHSKRPKKQNRLSDNSMALFRSLNGISTDA